MLPGIDPVRLNHLNAVLEDFDASVAHFRDLYGAELLADYPQRELHAGLLSIGRVIIEPFVPHSFLLNSRYGPHYLGVEYQADMAQVREAITAHGVRIVRDIGAAVHTHPADTFGVAFEFYNGSFHDRDWPLLGRQMKSPQYWHDEHALGLTGLKCFTLAVAEMNVATTFLQSFLKAKVIYESARPAVAAHAVGLQVADSVIELLTPVGEGVLQRQLYRFGEGIYSTVFGVREIDQARRYFGERGVVLEPGTAHDTFAVPAEANLGLRFEFAA